MLTTDENGFRSVWQAETEDSLNGRWADIRVGYERFYAERDAYEHARGEPDETPSGLSPKIWVGSLADYANGRLHGEWFDATCEPNELSLAAKFMLRGGRMSGAEEWAVMDYDSFGPLCLGEAASFETISKIANGIAEYGEEFAAWASYVGVEDAEVLDRFADHYRGEWDSFEEYIKDYLEETEFYRFLEHVPEDMRGYIEVNVEQIARDWRCDYEVVERPGGGVWVFEPEV